MVYFPFGKIRPRFGCRGGHRARASQGRLDLDLRGPGGLVLIRLKSKMAQMDVIDKSCLTGNPEI